MTGPRLGFWPPTAIVNHVHSSSRFDRPAATLIRDVKEWITEASIVTLTEIQGDRGARLRAELGAGGRLIHPARSANCGIVIDPLIWSVIHSEVAPVSEVQWWTRTGFAQPLTAATSAILEHKATSRRLLVSVVHYPSSVEGRRRWSDVRRRVQAHRSTSRGWRTHALELADDWKTSDTLLACDLNLNIRRAWVRRLLRRRWASHGFRWTWARPFPKQGTHHRRLIDITLTTMSIWRPAKLLPLTSSSDHRAYSQTLRWRRL